MGFLIDMIGGFLSPFIAPILGVIGAALAGLLAYWKGQSDQKRKGQIAVQKETIDAHKTRDAVEDHYNSLSDDGRKRLHDKWSRVD